MAIINKLVKLRNIKRALEIRPDEKANIYQISGRIRKFRSYKSFNFIDLVDGSTLNHIQTIVNKNLLDKPELGAYLICQGNLVSSPGLKQDVEFKVSKLDYLGSCDPSTYPLASSDELPTNLIRRLPHLRPRSSQFASLLRIRSELELSLHMIMKQMDFFRVHTPSLTSNDSEASGDLFTVKRTKLQHSKSSSSDSSQDSLDEGAEEDDDDDNNGQGPLCSDHNEHRVVRDDYFRKDVFLVTSAQLHLESLAASLSRVYTLSTAFRAENSLSKRHLCEFLMFEAEEANLTELEPLMNRVESIVKFIAQYLAEVSEHRSDFTSLLETNSNSDIFKKLTSAGAYIRMPYGEALKIFQEKTDFSGNTAYGSDIGRIQERMLLEYCDNVPIFITNYPKHLKPFYMKCDANDKEAQCFDLIAPHGGEICGGSLREDSMEKLETNLRVALARANPSITTLRLSADADVQHFNWYLDSRRFGSFPHGGFGVGVERLVQSLLGIKNIRDTTGFPRWAGHCPM